MVATRLEAIYNPVIGFLPQLGLAAVLLLGGESVIHKTLSLGQFTAFFLYLNMLINPMRSLGVTLNLAQRATASGARIFQLLDRAPRLTSPEQPLPLPPGNGHVQLRGVSLRYEDTDNWGAAYSHARETAGSPAATPPAGSAPASGSLSPAASVLPAGSPRPATPAPRPPAPSPPHPSSPPHRPRPLTPTAPRLAAGPPRTVAGASRWPQTVRGPGALRRAPCCTTSSWTCRAGARSRSWAPRARARRASCR